MQLSRFMVWTIFATYLGLSATVFIAGTTGVWLIFGGRDGDPFAVIMPIIFATNEFWFRALVLYVVYRLAKSQHQVE